MRKTNGVDNACGTGEAISAARCEAGGVGRAAGVCGTNGRGRDAFVNGGEGREWIGSFNNSAISESKSFKSLDLCTTRDAHVEAWGVLALS